MGSRLYRSSSQYFLHTVVIGLAGVLASLGLGYLVSLYAPLGWALAAVALTMLAFLVVGAWLFVAVRRKRIRRIKEDLERHAFLVDEKPDNARKADVFAPVAELQSRLGLHTGSEGLLWVALADSETSSTCLLEHMYVTGGGRTFQEHFHSVMAWLAPPPTKSTGIRFISAFRANWLQHRTLSKRTDRIVLGDPSFDESWIVLGDPDGARRFFSPAMRARLADSPKGESWHVGPHWFACAFPAAFDAQNLTRFRLHCEAAFRCRGS